MPRDGIIKARENAFNSAPREYDRMRHHVTSGSRRVRDEMAEFMCCVRVRLSRGCRALSKIQAPSFHHTQKDQKRFPVAYGHKPSLPLKFEQRDNVGDMLTKPEALAKFECIPVRPASRRFRP